MAQLNSLTVSENATINDSLTVTGLTVNDSLNTNYLFINNTEIDYIVEQGVSGIWYYRKWNSGIMEIWGKYYLSNVAMTTAWGNMYESSKITLPSFPFSFIEIPYGQLSWQNGTCAAWFEYFQPSITTGGDTFLCRPSSLTGSGYASMYVIGKWK